MAITVVAIINITQMCFEKEEGNEYHTTDIENNIHTEIQKHILTLEKSLYPVYCTLPPREPCPYEYAGRCHTAPCIHPAGGSPTAQQCQPLCQPACL